ncbi:PPE family protein PPE26 [Mycobacterium simulans]|uniref:PPE family protein PPE26 n=1 Tax=Mycobacterium simulans TaxID=627089 RepID=A0A7Z7IHA9_9MYCO|nr:PPE family protein [Mycobacterium simulans]SOJ53463.1 PPE family protein PPE26 [Mycobacterium simulans]
MDFGALPPEINSGRMYAGPGSSSMLAAASAWNALACELNSVAASYETIVSELTGEEWLGPASASMAAAIVPFVAWMNATAAGADLAATQARAAATVFETALAAVVPPPLIAANRTQLSSLVATNVLGQNAAAIAANEAEYAEMWAKDALVMYNYGGTSASAATVTPFSSPPEIAGPADVAAAAKAATSTFTGTAHSTLAQVINTVPAMLRTLSSPVANPFKSLQPAKGPLSWLWEICFGTPNFPNSLSGLLTAYGPYASFFYNTEGLPYFSVGMLNSFVQSAKSVGMVGGVAASAVPATKGLAGLSGLLGGGQVSAGLGNAASVGRLSVPPVWGGQLPGFPVGSAPLPVSTVNLSPEAGAGDLLSGMPMGGARAGATGSGPRYGVRPTVMARPPFAG